MEDARLFRSYSKNLATEIGTTSPGQFRVRVGFVNLNKKPHRLSNLFYSPKIVSDANGNDGFVTDVVLGSVPGAGIFVHAFLTGASPYTAMLAGGAVNNYGSFATQAAFFDPSQTVLASDADLAVIDRLVAAPEPESVIGLNQFLYFPANDAVSSQTVAANLQANMRKLFSLPLRTTSVSTETPTVYFIPADFNYLMFIVYQGLDERTALNYKAMAGINFNLQILPDGF